MFFAPAYPPEKFTGAVIVSVFPFATMLVPVRDSVHCEFRSVPLLPAVPDIHVG